MSDITFSTLWESVDYSLHKITHILKGTLCVSDADSINETIDTLVHLALDEVEETREHLDELRKYCPTLEKVGQEQAAPPTQSDQPF